MEDDLNYFQMGEDLNILVNGRKQQFFVQMEDDLNIRINGRQPLKIT